MKLHLGCGQKYFKGYNNIDFPSKKHSVQGKSVADIKTDFTQLSYPASSIDEVRLHHVFEHFTCPIACGLLVTWRSWLKSEGILRIEVPDFKKTALVVLNPLTNQTSKAVALRHIFGSHEASWAIHYEGWTINRLTKLLKNMGFKIINIKKNSWKGTYNFEVIVKKNKSNISNFFLDKIVEKFLSDYLVNSSREERKLLNIWMTSYKHQVNRCLV